ncbi:MAG: ParB/RepB/Spo0J family partition protein [Nanoarchaeota archaeon]|nr:ParB/RepB/Spo0J family partition protein [Nanoarchaeota archaeon]
MKDFEIVSIEIPLEKIQPDPNQPRKDLGIDEENRLINSMREIGLRSPIAVVKIGENKYRLINGHRRFACAKLLGWKTIRCEIHPETEEGEIKRLRFDLQNNIRSWKPLERSQEVKQIKESKKFKSNKELANYLHYPENLLNQSLFLQRRREKYQKLMDEFGLTETYQVEFVRLEPKIRPIKEFTYEQIILNLFERVRHQVIRSAKGFRKLGTVFLRAHTNEKELYRFLKDPDMTVDELTQKTTRSGFIRDAEGLTKRITSKFNQGLKLQPEDVFVLRPLRDVLIKYLGDK